MNQGLVQYLQQQIRTTNERLKRFTHSPDGKKHPRRFIFVKLQKYIDDFVGKKSENRMVVIPGFRGVGKTTLMAQTCTEYQHKVEKILFLSIEDAKNLFDAGIAELMSAYEEILGNNLESVKEPILIFLDEIQSDPKWAVTLKSLFEKTSNIFFCCTGSSALVLQTTTNLARRAVFEKMPPMCFPEYEMIKNGVYPPKLKEKIRQAVYFSLSAEDVYNNLLPLQASVHQYWSKVNRADIRAYLAYGTLPFSFVMPNESAVYDSISLLLDKIIRQDLPILGNFDQNTLGVVKRIIFAIAENDTTSLNVLEDKFKINRLTIASIFDALEKAELLIKIPAYGSNMTIAKKPNKYLFMSPAIRMSFFYFTGQESTYLTRQGKLLEDSIGSHLYREFIIRDQGAIRYDSQQGGADFILQILNNKQIIIEVGMGDKDKKQILNSMKKINSDYNLIFSSSGLAIDKEAKTVSIPLEYYFLM
ncbi:ATP-binding protein [Candidatus Peregrinibacteria bacterium]|nr:ATP-binding protein [Candidatus Peregrinibacteria bacterium]